MWLNQVVPSQTWQVLAEAVEPFNPNLFIYQRTLSSLNNQLTVYDSIKHFRYYT